MTTQILQHEQPQQQAWPWMCSGSSAWSKRVAAMDHLHGETTSTSWEVRAFAEDASSSGQWPPRSYSCSFCQREFRTAQALGGHMNVHRRERAHANQLAQLRNARFISSKTPSPTTTTTTTTTTVDLLQSPKSESENFISSPESESINSSMQTKPFLHDIFAETLSTQQQYGDHSPSRSLYYHPYGKSTTSTAARCKLSGSQGRFSLCLNKVMGERHDDALVDLELRLGRSSCAV